MDKRLVLLPLALLAGTSLSGCAAVAIPALAGSAIFGTRVVDGEEQGASPQAAPAPGAEVTRPEAPSEAAAPAPAPSISTVQARPTAPAQSRAAETAAAAAAAPPIAYPDPARPLPPEQVNFARFVRYTAASARQAADGAELPSAILSDPVALDGKRRRCASGEQLVAVIDLDPAGGVFNPPAKPAKAPGLALGLALLRTAGIEIAWLSDLPTTEAGSVRTALEQADFDPRGQDIISLRRDEGDTKQKRRDNLAGITCLVAIVGDERADFDERYKYLRSPEAGAGLEPLIGDGWFLTAPLLGK